MSNFNDWENNSNNIKDENIQQEVQVQNYTAKEETVINKKKKSNFKTYLSLVLITSILSSSVVGGALYSKFSSELKNQTALIQKSNLASSLSSKVNSDISYSKTSLESGASVTDIAKKVGPSIIGIRVTTNSKQKSFFSDSNQSQVEGSGVIISQDGYIMTNYHVVENADPKNGYDSTLEVFLPDSRQAKGKFIGGDSKNDLAVIKIDLDNLPVAELGDSSQLEVGELAVAIGNPLGMEFAGSVTVGVISALNRTVEMEDKTLSLIQTDAAINPGNSGGALVNSKGQVIGINTVKISVSGVEGLGFSIPINTAKPIIEQLENYGYVKGRPFIGISGKEITDVISQQYNLPVGIYISDVTAGSGASNAGIKKSDVLVAIGGTEVKTMKDVDNVKKNYKAGDTVDVTVVRNGDKKTFKLTFTEEK